MFNKKPGPNSNYGSCYSQDSSQTNSAQSQSPATASGTSQSPSSQAVTEPRPPTAAETGFTEDLKAHIAAYERYDALTPEEQSQTDPPNFR